jgi:hypothetical protein
VATVVAADEAWRLQVKQAHPLLGRLRLAFTPRPGTSVPQHFRTRGVGPDGEQKVGRRLDAWVADGPGRFVLHDRRVPGTRSNIDHIVVAASGVWVIGAKECSGRVQHVDIGGPLRPDWRLEVAGRDRSKLAEGVLWQLEQVGAAMDRGAGEPPPRVAGVLCLVGADWSLFPRPFVLNGVHVAWPAATIDLLAAPGPAGLTGPTGRVATWLSEAFPPA